VLEIAAEQCKQFKGINVGKNREEAYGLLTLLGIDRHQRFRHKKNNFCTFAVKF
jgi:uncharacterized membrane protein (UPF0127 family)